MKRFLFFALASSAAALGLAGVSCTGTETGNPELVGTLRLALTSGEPGRIAVSSADGQGSEWSYVSGDVVVESFSLHSCKGLTSGVEGSGAFETSGSQISIPSGSYCSLSLNLSGGQSGERRTVELLGTRGDGTPLGFSYDVAGEFWLEPAASPHSMGGAQAVEPGEPSIEIEPDKSYVLALDLAVVFPLGVVSDVSAADDSSIATEEDAPWVQESLVTGIVTGTYLYEDEDGDGQVDPGSEALMVPRQQ